MAINNRLLSAYGQQVNTLGSTVVTRFHRLLNREI